MTWDEALKVGLVVIASLGGGGGIVFGLSRLIGEKWLQEWRGDIDAKLQRLDAELKHRNYVLQRLAELELVALAECWQAARACLPLINATRPHDSGTDEAVLLDNARRLGDAHNVLIEVVGKHEVFLPDSAVTVLDTVGQTVRLELSHIRNHEHFRGRWWEEADENRRAFQSTCEQLRQLVKSRTAQLRVETASTKDS